jgi:hypothetical protein
MEVVHGIEKCSAKDKSHKILMCFKGYVLPKSYGLDEGEMFLRQRCWFTHKNYLNSRSNTSKFPDDCNIFKIF